MRVLIVAEMFPNRLQSWLNVQIQGLLEVGVDVSVVASDVGPGYDADDMRQLAAGCSVQYLPMTSGRELYGRLLRSWRAPAFQRRYAAGLSRYLIKSLTRPRSLKARNALGADLFAGFHYDVVHAHFETVAESIQPFCSAAGIPLLLTYHGAPPSGVGGLSPERRLALYRRCSRVLVNTRFTASSLKQLGCASDRITIVPQGVDLSWFPYSPLAPPGHGDVLQILTVARVHTDKGLEYALEAVSKLRERGIDVMYRVAGAGPHREHLEGLARRLGIADRVQFLGLQTADQLRQLYQGSHVMLLPSLEYAGGRAETQGVVIQEAQAAGCLVLASRTGGIPECVADGENAFLVPQRDAEAIAARIQRLLAEPEQWSAIRLRARQWVEERFDYRETVRQTIRIYEDARAGNQRQT